MTPIDFPFSQLWCPLASLFCLGHLQVWPLQHNASSAVWARHSIILLVRCSNQQFINHAPQICLVAYCRLVFQYRKGLANIYFYRLGHGHWRGPKCKTWNFNGGMAKWAWKWKSSPVCAQVGVYACTSGYSASFVSKCDYQTSFMFHFWFLFEWSGWCYTIDRQGSLENSCSNIRKPITSPCHHDLPKGVFFLPVAMETLTKNSFLVDSDHSESCVCTVSTRAHHIDCQDAGHNVCKIVRKLFQTILSIFSCRPLICLTL